MQALVPHLEILAKAQRRLWSELSAVPDQFVLYGGTALALHLGHRSSIDFDFFCFEPLDIGRLESDIAFLSGAKIIQRERNTLIAVVDRGGPVMVSFFGVPKLPRLAQPLLIRENNLRVAALIDIAGTQASVIQVRAEAKDYRDMDALMTQGQVSLATALAAAQVLYGPTFNPEVTLKALSYFADGNRPALPEDLQNRLVTAAREVDLDELPDLGAGFLDSGRDRGGSA